MKDLGRIEKFIEDYKQGNVDDFEIVYIRKQQHDLVTVGKTGAEHSLALLGAMTEDVKTMLRAFGVPDNAIKKAIAQATSTVDRDHGAIKMEED